MPIGNLTSQLFANVYLNEWDRQVRHVLKPLTYVRYGDDFLIFSSSKLDAMTFRGLGTRWLRENLSLNVNPRQDIIVPVRRGLFTLGHRIFLESQVVIEDSVFRRAMTADISAVASYRALNLSHKQRRVLEWINTPRHSGLDPESTRS